MASITPSVYERVGDLFRDRFGPTAGWAHAVLFAAELPAFRAALPAHVVDEMDAFRDDEKRAAKEAREARKARPPLRKERPPKPAAKKRKPAADPEDDADLICGRRRRRRNRRRGSQPPSRRRSRPRRRLGSRPRRRSRQKSRPSRRPLIGGQAGRQAGEEGDCCEVRPPEAGGRGEAARREAESPAEEGLRR